MTVGELLDRLAIELAGSGVPPARADARDLIAAVLDRPKFWPSANQAVQLSEPDTRHVLEAAERLGTGMPMQYAIGTAAFRHLTLKVDQRALIPRPETEVLVEIALAIASGGGTIVDVGTGSGAIALALVSEGKFDRVIATDISPEALSLARENLALLPAEQRAKVEFRLGDLLEPVRGDKVRAIVSNPPYISPSEADGLPAIVRDWEPHLALFSDDEGMAAIRALLREAPDVLEPGGVLVLELDSSRAALARELAETDTRYRAVELRLDLTGRERFLVARRKES